MPVEWHKSGLRLCGTELWLDARRQAPLSFVSHAHTDHIARHQRVIATPATLRLMQHRLGPLADTVALDYRQPLDVAGVRLELFSAGHVLGSAQVRITRPDGHRVVYTGDLGLSSSLTASPAELAPCDTLIIESTFGHPKYRFPPRDDVFGQVADWARRELARGQHPILYAYSLGKAQETIAQLAARGLPVCVHPAIHDITLLYQELGVPISSRRFEGELLPGEVGVFPPFGRSQAMRRTPGRATAVLTGWALEPWAARRYGADLAFPVSDHADFPSLVAWARASGAREIITLHGFADELAQALRREGMFARAATQKVQLELGLGEGRPPPGPLRRTRR